MCVGIGYMPIAGCAGDAQSTGTRAQPVAAAAPAQPPPAAAASVAAVGTFSSLSGYAWLFLLD